MLIDRAVEALVLGTDVECHLVFVPIERFVFIAGYFNSCKPFESSEELNLHLNLNFGALTLYSLPKI